MGLSRNQECRSSHAKSGLFGRTGGFLLTSVLPVASLHSFKVFNAFGDHSSRTRRLIKLQHPRSGDSDAPRGAPKGRLRHIRRRKDAFYPDVSRRGFYANEVSGTEWARTIRRRLPCRIGGSGSPGVRRPNRPREGVSNPCSVGILEKFWCK